MFPWFVILVLLWPVASDRCLKDEPEIQVKKHFKLVEDLAVLLPLKLAYSRRVSHQFTTHVLKLVLEELLGYEHVQLVQEQSGLRVEDVLQQLLFCPNLSSCSCTSSSNQIPEVMIHTGVLMPAEHQYQSWLDKDCVVNAGPITEYGRFGCYIPKDFVENLWDDKKIVADHWRGLAQATILDQLKQNLTALKAQQNLTELERSCHGAAWCSGGFFHGTKCQSEQNCAVLLSDYPDHHGAIIKQQIINLSLNVSVVWLGSNLGQTVSGLVSNRPFLLFSWEPNTLTSNTNLTRVSFPACRPGISFAKLVNSENGTFDCDFPYSHVRKFAWSKVRENAPDVHRVLSKLYFPRTKLHKLLKLHKDAGGHMTSAELACYWLRGNRDTWLSWLPARRSGKIPVYLGGMFPSATNAVWSDPGILIGVQMALEKINNDSTVLDKYSLHVDVRDTQCSTALVLDAFIDFISHKANRTLVGIMGPACSVQTEIVAEIAPFYNTVVMGYSVEGVGLANRQKFPLFYRTSPSYSEYKYAYASMFQFFGWKQYATLTDTNYVSTTITDTHKHLDSRGISLVYSRLIANQDASDIKIYLESLKERSGRIIIASLFDGLARTVVCEAYLQGMTPQNGYVWLLPWWLARDWWDTEKKRSGDADVQVPCSKEQMNEFVSAGYFSLSNAFYGNSWQKIQGSLTISEWRREYEKRVNQQNLTKSDYAAYAYDAVWTYALALQELLTSHPAALDTIRTNATTHRLQSHLARTDFMGVSGHVTFKAGERYLSVVEIRQEFPGIHKTVGKFNPEKNGMCEDTRCLTMNESKIAWPGDKRPTDGTQETTDAECSVESFRAYLDISCSEAVVVITVICIGLFLIAVIAFIWICIKRRYDRKYKETQHRMEELGLMEQSSLLQLDEWEVPRAQVVLNRKLGEGAFGTVYGGEAIRSTDEENWVPVAVKTLKIGSTPEDKLEFLSEAETMKIFNHPNIVKLLGVCTKGEPAYTIMELMIHGDLKNFLLARRQFANQDCKEAEDVVPAQLTRMSLDIAKGLAYLAELKFVHRDLALRNCMVGSGHVVRLGDFGMARAMYDSDYYRFGRKGMLPVRWMSPESLADGVFTIKSDVWSLGVTYWELATFGSFPYQGLANGEVVESVKLGRKMDAPQGCTDQLADLLKECWRRKPEERPEPQSIVELLEVHPSMMTACLDSPSTSVPVMEEELGMRFRSSGRGTPSPSSTRSRTLSQLTEEHFRIFRTSRSSSETPAVIVKSGSSKLDQSRHNEVAV